MTDAVLQRMESGDQGTFGRIFARGLSLFTGELPWRLNLPSISCVPAGVYTALFTPSPRFHRKLYLVGPVPRRSGIRIHPATFMGDSSKGFRCQLNGCIAVAEKLGWMDGQKVVLVSAPAVRKLEQAFGGRPFKLEIRNP